MTINSFKKLKKKTSGQFQGFTLVEALTAVAVVTIGLVAILGVVAYAISISRVSPNEVIAANLAQESIEVIRNIRDTSLLAGGDFDDGIMPPGGLKWANIDFDTVGGFVHLTDDQVGGDIITCAQAKGDTCRLFLDGDGFYSSDNTGEPTNFYRIVRLKQYGEAGGLHYIRVVSYAAWQDRKGNWRNIGVEDNFYEYDLEDVASDVKNFEWVASGAEVPCLALTLERDPSDTCKKAGSKYHKDEKCGRCCLQPSCDDYDAADPLSGDFLYISPWDTDTNFQNPFEVTAFLGDPKMVCDIVNGGTCRIFEKVEVE